MYKQSSLEMYDLRVETVRSIESARNEVDFLRDFYVSDFLQLKMNLLDRFA